MASLQYDPLSSRILSLERETDEKSFRIAGTSKEIPKFQRRGAIITLGMFAQPKPGVVAEHVETLLKIGLGSLGRVRPFLVRVPQTVDTDSALD